MAAALVPAKLWPHAGEQSTETTPLYCFSTKQLLQVRLLFAALPFAEVDTWADGSHKLYSQVLQYVAACSITTTARFKAHSSSSDNPQARHRSESCSRTSRGFFYCQSCCGTARQRLRSPLRSWLTLDYPSLHKLEEHWEQWLAWPPAVGLRLLRVAARSFATAPDCAFEQRRVCKQNYALSYAVWSAGLASSTTGRRSGKRCA